MEMLEILWLSINNCGHCRVGADGGESLRALAGWFLATIGCYWLEMEILSIAKLLAACD